MTNLIDLLESAFNYGEGKPKKAHWPSEFCDCPRKIVYSWMGTKKTNPIESTGWWRIKFGESIHVLCQETLADIARDPEMKAALTWEGFEVDAEVRSGMVPILGLDFPISYRMDEVFTDADGKKVIAEFKTTFGFGMRDVKEKGPKDNALAQVLAYLQLSKEIYPERIDRAYIMYISRDNADRVLFVFEHVFEMEESETPDGKTTQEVEKGWKLSRMFPGGDLETMKTYTPDLWSEALKKLKFVEDHVKEQSLPDRPYLVAIKNGEIRDKFTKDKVEYKSAWQCQYCSYCQKCWQEYAEKYSEGDNSESFKKGDEDLAEF